MAKIENRIFVFVTGLILAIFFLVSPARALTSLQGCIQDPACAASMAEYGLTGASSVPQGVATVPGAVSASSRIFIPNVGDALGLGAGVAGLSYPWGQDAADSLASSYGPPVGEDGVADGTPYGGLKLSFYSPNNSRTITASVLSYHIFVSESTGKYVFDANPCNGSGFDGSGPNITPSTLMILASGVCFAPDEPAPDFEIDPSRIPEIAGSPVQVPWPDPLIFPGPDGQIGTEDDELYYPPLEMPGSFEEPTIVLDPVSGSPDWRESPTDYPNPASPDYNPSTDPNSPDYDPNYDPDAPPAPNLNPAPSQSSDCDGWGYAICKLSDNFPFDVVGNLPDAGDEPPCPSFTSYGQTLEFCFINDLMRAAKWLVAMALTIAVVVNL